MSDNRKEFVLLIPGMWEQGITNIVVSSPRKKRAPPPSSTPAQSPKGALHKRLSFVKGLVRLTQMYRE